MKSILIIDDKEDVRLVVKTALVQFGFATYEATNGREGIELALTHVPDLIICDVNLGGMDGFSTLEAIRKLPLFASTPFILMTGSVGKEGFRRGMNCGADDYLQKPFQPEELIEAVVSRLVRHAEMQADLLQRAERINLTSPRPASEEAEILFAGIAPTQTVRRLQAAI